MVNYIYDNKANSYGYTNKAAPSRVNAVHAVQSGDSLIVPMQSVQFGGYAPSSGGADTRALQFLNEFERDMRSLSSAADKLRALNPGNVWENLEITSADPSTATVSELGNRNISQLANYAINVKQLASSQSSTSKAVQATDSGAFTDGTFTLTSGRKDDAGNALDLQVRIDTAGKTNRQALEDIAGQIENQFETLGIHARVETNGAGEAQLKLESVDSGKTHGFSLTGGGENMTLTNQSEAKNLVYTVNKNNQYFGKEEPPDQEYESNHFVKIDAGTANQIHNKTLTIDFKKTGQVNISTNVDSEKITKLTEDFANKYNKAVDMLVDNAYRGNGVETTRNRFLQAPISKDAMKTIGLDWGEDGKISLDTKKFQDVLKRDPRKVYDLLSDNYSVTDTAYQKTQSARTQSTESLLSNGPQFPHGCGCGGGGVTVINNFFVLPMPYAYNYSYTRVRNTAPLFLNMLL